jgi:YVTN family beta-propeller protein
MAARTTRALFVGLTVLSALGGVLAPLAQPVSAQPARGQTLVVVNQHADEVAFFDADHKRLGTVDLPAHPHEMTLSPDKKTLYVSVYGSGIFTDNIHPGKFVYPIDVATRKAKEPIDVSPYQAPHGMAWDADGFLWVTADKSNCVVVVDPKTNKVVADVPTQSQGSHWVDGLPNGTKAYTSNKFSPFLSVLDMKKRKMTKRIELPNGSEGIAVSPDGKKLYVSDHKDYVLYVVDTEKDAIVERVKLEGLPTLPPNADPLSRVAVSPDGKKIFVAFFATNKLVCLDADPLKQTKVVKTGHGPMGFAFPTDKSKMYLTNFLAGTISVWDVETAEVLDTFAASKKPDSGPETLLFLE